MSAWRSLAPLARVLGLARDDTEPWEWPGEDAPLSPDSKPVQSASQQRVKSLYLKSWGFEKFESRRGLFEGQRKEENLFIV